MKKTVLLVIVVLVLICANFGLRYVHIASIENNIKIFSNMLSENGIKFSYKSVNYGGIAFWNINAYIKNPVFFQEKQRYSEEANLDYIDINSNLLNKQLHMIFSDKVTTLVNDDEREYRYVSTFTGSPSLRLKFIRYRQIINNKALVSEKLERYFVKNIERLDYRSFGHKVNIVDEGNKQDELVYTIGSTKMKVENLFLPDNSGYSIGINLYDLEYYDSLFKNSYFGLISEVGKSDYVLDAKVFFDFGESDKVVLNDIIMENIKPTYKISINDFELSTELYDFKAKGDILFNKTEIIPYFDLSFDVANVPNMINFYAKFYNNLILKADIMKALSLEEITQEQKDAILHLFEKIAKKSKDSANYSLKITKLKEAQVKVEEYTLDQVIKMYKELVVEKQRIEKDLN